VGFNSCVGSSPISGIYALIAQSAEQLICNQQAIGSSPFQSFMYL
jgi:hypothetical protein